MSTRSGNLERTLGGKLPLDVEKIGINRRSQPHHRLVLGDRVCRRVPGVGAQVLDHLQQRARRKDRDAADQRGFVGALVGHDEAAARPDGVLRLRHCISHRECAAHRPQFAGQRQFAGELILIERPGRNLASRRQYSECDRKVEAARFLRQVGRSQVHSDPSCRKLEAARQQRGADALARLAHFGIGQAHQRKRRQAVRQVNFNGHLRGVHARKATGADESDGHGGGCGGRFYRRQHARLRRDTPNCDLVRALRGVRRSLLVGSVGGRVRKMMHLARYSVGLRGAVVSRLTPCFCFPAPARRRFGCPPKCRRCFSVLLCWSCSSGYTFGRDDARTRSATTPRSASRRPWP